MPSELKMEWRPVCGFEGLYEVNNLGEIRNVRKGRFFGKVLRPNINKSGYSYVALFNHSKEKCLVVHRAVAEAFIPNPDKKRTVNHIDGNKQNNCVENLEWATHGENHKHAYRIGLKTTTDKQRENCSKLGKRTCELNRPRKPVIMISDNGEKTLFESARAAGRSVNVDASAIVACCRGRTKTSKGFRWEYA